MARERLRYRIQAFAGALGAQAVLGVVTPQDTVRHVVAAVVFHNDAVAHTLAITLDDSQNTFTATALRSSVGLAPVGASLDFPLDREVVLAPGTNLRGVSLEPIGAGAQVFLRLIYWDETRTSVNSDR